MAIETVASALGIERALSQLLLRCGQVQCPGCGRHQGYPSVSENVARVMSLTPGARCALCVPLQERGKKLQWRCQELAAYGFSCLRIDGDDVALRDIRGTILASSVALVMDRWIVEEGGELQVREELEWALGMGHGRCRIDVEGREPLEFVQSGRCDYCDGELPCVQPSLSSALELGWGCTECFGSGDIATIDVQKFVRDPNLSIVEGAITPWHEQNHKFWRGVLLRVCRNHGIDSEVPWSRLSDSHKQLLLYGEPDSSYKGVVYDMQCRLAEWWAGRPKSDFHWMRSYLTTTNCEGCHDGAQNSAACAVTLAGLSLTDLYSSSLAEFPHVLDALEGTATKPKLALRLRRTIERCMRDVDMAILGDLLLGRLMSELSDDETRSIGAARLGKKNPSEQSCTACV